MCVYLLLSYHFRSIFGLFPLMEEQLMSWLDWIYIVLMMGVRVSLQNYIWWDVEAVRASSAIKDGCGLSLHTMEVFKIYEHKISKTNEHQLTSI